MILLSSNLIQPVTHLKSETSKINFMLLALLLQHYFRLTMVSFMEAKFLFSQTQLSVVFLWDKYYCTPMVPYSLMAFIDLPFSNETATWLTCPQANTVQEPGPWNFHLLNGFYVSCVLHIPVCLSGAFRLPFVRTKRAK